MEYYRTQQQLEFFGSIFRQPADIDGLGGRGVQNTFLLCPVDLGSRLLGKNALDAFCKHWEAKNGGQFSYYHVCFGNQHFYCACDHI